MSSNGRTPDSDSGYIGSNPVVSATYLLILVKSR